MFPCRYQFLFEVKATFIEIKYMEDISIERRKSHLIKNDDFRLSMTIMRIQGLITN